MKTLFSKNMMKNIFCQGYLWLLLLLLYSPIFIIVIFSFTEAKVMGNWTGFSLQLYKNLFVEGTHHSLTAALINTVTIALITATVSTLFGTLTAIGIHNLRNKSTISYHIRQQYPDTQRRHHHRYLTLPALHHVGHSAGLYHGGTLAYHLLSALRHPERHAPSEADEPQPL